ncbi:MAG: hypothetical protein A3H31_02580 [Gallionellales bacterium RIFCSPLOWO2_02_FULL_57_47]|nr:MAG: hypothetical protein A3H31_02580 [Gallionellales bacterium RIFCSPLOWO2_02_FULL_57_47]
MSKQIQETCDIAAPHTPAGKASLEALRNAHPDDLARLGISWNGGKAVGLSRGELLPVGVNLADLVIEDRR